MASSHITNQVTHKLTVGRIALGADAHVTCNYPNGQMVHGPKAEEMSHPGLRVSIGDQDCLLWTSRFPFEVALNGAPSGLFFRPLPWVAVRGRDDLFRVHSGPMNPRGLERHITRDGFQIKFTITLLESLDPPVADQDTEPLDPHIIVEP